MPSINRVTLAGHLGRDPETKSFANGGSVCNFSIATSEKWKSKDGQPQEHTEWHNIVCNDKTGELAQKYLRKGSAVLIEGSIKTRKYQDKEGKEARFTEIRCERLHFLGSSNQPDKAQASRGGQAATSEDPMDSIPF